MLAFEYIKLKLFLLFPFVSLFWGQSNYILQSPYFTEKEEESSAEQNWHMGQASSCWADTAKCINKSYDISGNGNGNGKDLTQTLPDECLIHVLEKLGCHDRNTCSLVCKRWRLLDSKSRHRLSLHALSDISASLLQALLSRFSCVSILSLKCSRKHLSIDNHVLSLIPTLLPSLNKLKLRGCLDVSDGGLIAFSLHHPRFLTKLSFASCGFGVKGLISLLSNCHSLRDLTLKRLRKLDSHNVNTLNFNLCQIQIERLCFKDLHNTRLFIPLLCSSKALKTLVVCRSSGNWDTVLETSLQGRTSSIFEIQMENVHMGDAGLSAISASCPDLQLLYLNRATDCTDSGLNAIANSCRKLKKLHIDHAGSIGDDGVLSIASRCCQLQELVLMGLPVTLVSLNALASSCPLLERMALCNTETIGDSEMAFIASKFCALKKLCIKTCPVSDSGIEAVGEGCPKLVKLKVKRCRGVTQKCVSRLRLLRTSLVVSVDAVWPKSFDEQGMLAMVNETETLPMPNTRMHRSTRTDVICSSRSASLLSSNLFGRRPN